MGRQPFIHTPDDFELSVDANGTPHFIDMRYLSPFGRRHGRNKAAFGLVLGTQCLVLVLTIIIGSLVGHWQLSNFELAFVLLAPLSCGLVAILVIIFLYYRRQVALIITAGGTALLVAIIGGVALFGDRLRP